MRRFLLIIAAVAFAVPACNKPLFDETPRWYVKGPRSKITPKTDPVDSSAMDLPARRGVYVTAIRFPDWANWREGDYRGAEAVLFRDSVVVSSAPAGPLPDADRIRQWNGHLWNDIADDGATTLYRDGVEQFSYPEEELLRGFLIENGSVHTLGQRPGSQGVCYRIDGEPLFNTTTGAALGSPSDREWEGGALMRDSTGIYYVYSIPFRKGEDVTREYHIMRGADEILSIPANYTGAIYDIRVHGGTVYRSERRNQSAQSLCLVMADMYLSLDIEADETVHQCKLVPIEGEIMIKGYSETPKGSRYWIRSRSGTKYANTTQGVQDLYVSDGKWAFIALEDGVVTRIQKHYSPFAVPEGQYRLMSHRCAQFKGNFFAVALSSATGTDNILILDGTRVPLNFNGYFTSLTII